MAQIDYDNVAGNYYDKYESQNPIARALMDGFLRAFDELSAQSGAKTAYEVGCGEGNLSMRLRARGLEVGGSDLEPSIVDEANKRAEALNSGALFAVRNLYELDRSEVDADLIVCCEVLEHIPQPSDAIDQLATITRSHLLVSVPREPLWRILNMARGKYLSALGNTPGHLNHWSPLGFLADISRRFEIVDVRKPLPWTMALCRPRVT
ncbi:class I SAM-dependent methyltransferase [Methyloceanibacter stevinii]|uniref:class I SAM-dependent methyltransferase n=1 Tax=Methyloceanibacter stevinii TaxID=1774970 RepID=UPI0019D39DA6|nr:methyltransferase [Methyloceanibacter stevinii]